MNVIAGIVTYNPDIPRLAKNLDAIINQVYKIVIVDNNSDNFDEIKKLVSKKIEIIDNSENYGIAKALNQIMKYAQVNNIEWVLTLDQDSICPQNMVRELAKNISDNIGIVCPTIYDSNKKNVTNESKRKENHFVNKCITSGSLTSVKAWDKIGKFDERMFIDGVDFEFCYRLKDYGYYIYKDDNVKLNHEIGHISVRRFLFWKVIVKNHSPFRKYYIAKNIIYFAKKRKNLKLKIKSVFQEIKLIGIALLYEDNKVKKIRRIIAGIRDGIKDHVG